MSAGSAYCVKCGSQLVEGAAFCAKCGAPVGRSPILAPPPGMHPGMHPMPAHAARKQREKKWIIGIAIVLLACAVLSSQRSGSNSSAATSGGSPTQTPPSQIAAVYLDPRILAADPTGHIGKNVFFQGKALNVNQETGFTWVQLMAQPQGKSDTESIVFEMPFRAVELIKGECFRIYGVVQGTQKVTRTFTGAQNEVPLVKGYAYSTSPADKYGSCESPSALR